jgi:hypothetical protein
MGTRVTTHLTIDTIEEPYHDRRLQYSMCSGYQYMLTDRVTHVLQSKNDRRNESNHSYTIPNIRTVHSCTLKTNDLYPIDPGMI